VVLLLATVVAAGRALADLQPDTAVADRVDHLLVTVVALLRVHRPVGLLRVANPEQNFCLHPKSAWVLPVVVGQVLARWDCAVAHLDHLGQELDRRGREVELVWIWGLPAGDSLGSDKSQEREGEQTL